MKNIFICLIRAYQLFISPFFPPSCRFTPSCSRYTIQAIHTHGVFWGIKLGFCRVLRCHPLHPGGWDPVPPVK